MADALKTNDWVVAKCREQLGRYDPVQIGASGQIKEYREENAYGEIGEKAHRHISRLMGLMPGTLINRTTPAWFEAATTPTVCSRKGKIPDVRFRGKPFRVGR